MLGGDRPGRIKITLTRFSSAAMEARKFPLNLPRRIVVSIVSQHRNESCGLNPGEPTMRILSSTVTALAVLFLALAPPAAIAQQPQQPQQQPQLSPPKA